MIRVSNLEMPKLGCRGNVSAPSGTSALLSEAGREQRALNRATDHRRFIPAVLRSHLLRWSGGEAGTIAVTVFLSTAAAFSKHPNCRTDDDRRDFGSPSRLPFDAALGSRRLKPAAIG